MVHRRSPHVLAARRVRAIERGFLCKRHGDDVESAAPSGARFLSPPPPPPPGFEMHGSNEFPVLGKSLLHNALELIQAQNCTIAQLTAKVEQLQATVAYNTATNTNTVQAPTNVTVEEQVSLRLQSCLDGFIQTTREDTGTQIKAMTDEIVNRCFHHTTELLTKYDSKVRSSVAAVAARIDALEENLCPRVEADCAKCVDDLSEACFSDADGLACHSPSTDERDADTCNDPATNVNSFPNVSGNATAAVVPSPGATVRVHGLEKADHYNDCFASVIGYDADSDRILLQFSTDRPGVKIKPENVEFPAMCPRCEAEVTSPGCFACGFGVG